MDTAREAHSSTRTTPGRWPQLKNPEQHSPPRPGPWASTNAWLLVAGLEGRAVCLWIISHNGLSFPIRFGSNFDSNILFIKYPEIKYPKRCILHGDF